MTDSTENVLALLGPLDEEEDFFDLLTRQAEHRRDTLLANVVRRPDGLCYWKECSEQAQTRVYLPTGQEWHFCWYHHAELRNAVLGLRRYEMMGEMGDADEQRITGS